MDMKGFTMGKFNQHTKKLFGITSRIGSDFYPETLYKSFIINAPFIFRGIWAGLKGFLDKKTVNKIHILGSK